MLGPWAVAGDGTTVADALSLETVFAVAVCAAALQIFFYARLALWDNR